MVDLTEGKLEEEITYAKSIGDTTLEYCVERLRQHDKNDSEREGGPFYTETKLYIDRDPRSFYFIRRRIENLDSVSNGGIIFHDFRNGDTGNHIVMNPDFKKASWQIHT